MKINEFLMLVPVFRFRGDPQGEPSRFYIPLLDFLEVMETNGLMIVNELEWENMGIEELIRRTPTKFQNQSSTPTLKKEGE